jgi:hypothetical protein
VRHRAAGTVITTVVSAVDPKMYDQDVRSQVVEIGVGEGEVLIAIAGPSGI